MYYAFVGTVAEFKKWLMEKIAEETLLRSHVALAHYHKK